jgi:hypothetical protein
MHPFPLFLAITYGAIGAITWSFHLLFLSLAIKFMIIWAITWPIYRLKSNVALFGAITWPIHPLYPSFQQSNIALFVQLHTTNASCLSIFKV